MHNKNPNPSNPIYSSDINENRKILNENQLSYLFILSVKQN